MEVEVVVESLTWTWDPFSPNKLPCPALIWGSFCIFLGYIWWTSLEACSFFEGKEEELILREELEEVEEGETMAGVQYKKEQWKLKKKKEYVIPFSQNFHVWSN